jgi:hypothetical protein
MPLCVVTCWSIQTGQGVGLGEAHARSRRLIEMRRHHRVACADLAAVTTAVPLVGGDKHEVRMAWDVLLMLAP